LSFWKKYGRTIAGIAITAFMPTMGAFFKTLGGKMITGFLSGAVSSGSLKGGLWGAFSAGVFHGIGQSFDKLASANKGASGLIAGLKPDQFAAKVLTHAAMGGVMSQLQGGKFGHGFISAGVVEALSPQIMQAKGGPAQVVVGALVGGTASVASGGKFGNGALTAAFQIAFNHGSEALNRKIKAYDERINQALALIAGTNRGAEMLRAIEESALVSAVYVELDPKLANYGQTKPHDTTRRLSFWQRLLGETSPERYAAVVTVNPVASFGGFARDGGGYFRPDLTRIVAHELAHVYMLATGGPVAFRVQQQEVVKLENEIAREIDPNAPIRHLTRDHGSWNPSN
jgi:hypothetical protein